MDDTHRAARFWLALLVVGHFVLTLAHGLAHQRAAVPLTALQNLFVFGVIVAGPPVGLAVSWVAPRTGSGMVSVAMAAAFLFGVINHFLLQSADHVLHVPIEVRAWFASTAVALAVTEAAGCLLAFRGIRERTVRP